MHQHAPAATHCPWDAGCGSMVCVLLEYWNLGSFTRTP